MSATPDPFRTLQKEIRKLQEQVRRLQNASSYTGTGIHPNGDGGIDSDTYESGVEGFSLKGNGDVELNGNLDVNGNTTIAGDLDITGSFTLPAASIDNSWLASLTGWKAISANTTSNWSNSSQTWQTKASTSVSVPSGYDTALVVTWGIVVFSDSDNVFKRFDTRCVIEGNVGPSIINVAYPIGSTTNIHTRSLGVTSGQVLDLSVQVWSIAANAAETASTAVCGGFALFSR